jgi:cytochrome c-type biogenesis protein CcmH
MTRTLAFCLAALALAAPALASEERPTLAELEPELICPTCQSTLDQSDAPIARRMKAFIAARIAAGDTKSEIKAALVAQFGERVLAEPPKEGFTLLAWVLPLAGLGAAALAVGLLAWRWSRRSADASAPVADPSSNGQRPLEPELEERLDEALARFD